MLAPEGIRLLVGADRIALSGALNQIGLHQHASPAVVVGVDGPLRFVADRSHCSRAALIAPGFSHAVDVGQGRIAVFLLPPHAIARGTLAPVCDLPHPARWVELGEALLRGEISAFEPVDHLLSQAALNTRPIDDRLRVAIGALWQTLDDNVPVEAIAADAKLSPSRLMGLAHEQMGTSLRRYRRWLRMFRVARDYSAGASLTTAALEAGFSSSAHLSAAAREHFGIRPSQILTPRSRAGILAI
jgi:AraC-like DNA-binding protein